MNDGRYVYETKRQGRIAHHHTDATVLCMQSDQRSSAAHRGSTWFHLSRCKGRKNKPLFKIFSNISSILWLKILGGYKNLLILWMFLYKRPQLFVGFVSSNMQQNYIALDEDFESKESNNPQGTDNQQLELPF